MKRYLSSLFEKRVDQLPALDGLRALAITMVIASHSRNDFVHAGGVENPSWFFNIVDYLWSGVDLFFVLSGFLIGRMLFQELKRTGSVEVAPFLLKRGFRIWPLYFFVCLVSLLKMGLTHSLPSLTHVLPDFLFLTNYFPETLAFGTWSLSVEEQFYILASVLIFTSGKWITHTGRRIVSVLAGLLIAAPFLRALTWEHYAAQGMSAFQIEWDILHNFITTHYDGLAIGLLFAALQVFAPAKSEIQSRVTWVLASILILLCGLTLWQKVYFEYSLAAVAFGLSVWYCLQKPASLFARAFSWPGFQVISRLSYGMYLWYRFPLWKIAALVMAHASSANSFVQYSLIFAIAFVCAAVTATFTYVLIERPFLELRSRVYHSKEKIIYASS